MRQLIVLLNAASGARDKEAVARELVTLFRAAGAEVTVQLAKSGSELIDMARFVAQQRPEAIVAGGGDGTISAVASTLVGTTVPLGVLALGTLNHFARDMRIPSGLGDAIRNIVAGHVVAVDVGEVNGRIFLNNSSLGLYPRIVIRRDQQQHKLGRGKWPAFAWAALTVLRRYGFMDVRICVDDKEIARRTPFVFIGNNQYEMEGLHIGVRESLTDGKLSLFMPRKSGRMALLMLALRALFRRLHDVRDFDLILVQSMSVETHRRRPYVAVDGEVTRLDAPLQYRVRHRALRVIVPAAEQRRVVQSSLATPESHDTSPARAESPAWRGP